VLGDKAVITARMHSTGNLVIKSKHMYVKY